MVFDLITEKYKQHRLEVGIKIGEERGRAEGLEQGRAEGLAEGLEEGLEQGREEAREHDRATRAWYARQQAALRAGLPFDEPPPLYYTDNGADGG